MRHEHVETEEDRLVARLIDNVCRRHVSAEEKSVLLERLGEVSFNEGVEPGKIAYEIAEETGMSYRLVMQYSPDKLKEKAGGGGRYKALKFDKSKEKTQEGKVARLATSDDRVLS